MVISNMNSSERNSSSFNEPPAFYLEEHAALRVVTAFLLSISALEGSFGNVLVIVVILKIKTLRTCGNYFVLNLALADLIVTFLIDPFNAVGAVAGRAALMHNSPLCTWISAFCAPACMQSMWNMMAISLNRYVLICHPGIYPRIFTKTNTILMCASVWIFCHLLHLPNHVGWGDSHFTPDYYLCTFDVDLHSYAIFYIITGVVIPLMGVLVGYAGIYRKVRSIRAQMKLYRSRNAHVSGNRRRNESRPKSDVSQDDIKLAKTLFQAFAVFLCSWALVVVLVLAHNPQTVPGWLYVVAIIMAHGNSAVNPVIYGLSNDKFREGYKVILGMRSKTVQPASNTNTKSMELTESKRYLSSRQQGSVLSASTAKTT